MGRNELIVFELNGASKHTVAGLVEPILNQVSAQAVLKKNRRPGQTMKLDSVQPVASGTFAAGKEWQTVTFVTGKGRYFCMEALNSQSDDPYTTCAELYLLGPEGKELPRDSWKIAYADSEETGSDDGRADNVFDLQFTTFWHTEWENAAPKHPHQLVIDFGQEQTVTGLRCRPRQDSPNGRIKDYRLYLSLTPFPGLE
jgi:beta-galactosidase